MIEEEINHMSKKRPPIYANQRSKIYHDATRNNDRCRKSAIKAANRKDFDSPEQAVEADYRACEHCYPDGE
jgi:methylphosphotriester-DNA--protein-cysteine methyltransferase